MTTENFDMEILETLGVEALFQASEQFNHYQSDEDRQAFNAAIAAEKAAIAAVIAELGIDA